MNKTIPIHSLVIAVGPSASSRAERISKYFASHEVISAQQVCESLVGESDRPDLNSVVFAEVRHRISLKLSLGERVVVDAPNLRREDRMALARLGVDVGAPVFYLLCPLKEADEPSLNRFYAAEREIMRGDGVAEVIDYRLHTPSPITKRKPDLATVKERWAGVTVISDVHGMYPSLLSALAWARSRRHYVVLLGDVIDYGPDTLEVADEVYRLVMRGEGELILGNHERKIARWANQMETGRSSIRLSDGNRVTTLAINALGIPARKKWLGRFRALIAQASYNRQIGNIVLAHAGVHPAFWAGAATPKEIETWSLFGEFETPLGDGSRPLQVHTWTEAVPPGTTVIVGHEIRSSSPMKVMNDHGGTTIFTDTGSGKGGNLSSVDLKFDERGLRVENFNLY
jgi:protein phosphatase